MGIFNHRRNCRSASDPFRSHRRIPVVESMEERIVPSIQDGTLLVPTRPTTVHAAVSFTGILEVDPNTGAESVLTQDGFFVTPTDITETPDGQLYVIDDGTNGVGEIIQINPSNGNQTLKFRSSDLYGPATIIYINPYFYVDCEGQNNGDYHRIYQIDPRNPTWTDTETNDGTAGGYTIHVPVGMYPVPGGGTEVYLLDQAEVSSPNDNRFVDGTVLKLDPSVWDDPNATIVAQGQKTPTSNSYLDTDWEYQESGDNGGVEETYGNPEDLVVDSSGNLIVACQGARGYDRKLVSRHEVAPEE